MIITIDGYSSQGKSFIGKALATELGIEFLSTGNIVRYVAIQYNKLYKGTEDPKVVLQQAVKIMQDSTMDTIVNCEFLKTPETEKTLEIIAKHPFVYDAIEKIIIRYSVNRNIILDGRYTFEFIPNAHRCYYFTSSNERRAYLTTRVKKMSHYEALEYLAFRDSFEPQHKIPSYVKKIEPEKFACTEDLIQFLKNDIYSEVSAHEK